MVEKILSKNTQSALIAPRTKTPLITGILTACGVAALGFLLSAASAQAATTTGVYTSPVKDFTTAVNLETISWVATTPPSTSVAIRARVCVDATCSTNPSWGSNLTNGQSISSWTARRYFQYEATLSSTDDYAAPTLSEVSVEYIIIGAASGTLTSSVYDTTFVGDFISVSWLPISQPVNTTFGMEVRAGTTLPPDSTWTGWTAAGNNLAAGTAFNGKRYIQYRVNLGTMDGTNTPVLEEIRMNYSEPFNYSLNWQATSPCGAGGLVCPPTGFISVNQGGSVLAAFDAIQTAGMTFENISFDYGPKTNGISVSPFSLSSCNDATSCSGVTATMRTTFTGGAGDTPTGNYTITITGTSATSGIIKTITFNLTVTAGFNFSLSLNNTSGSAYVNETASPLPTLTTTYVSGTSGTVSYSIVNPNPTNITIAPSTLASHTFTASGETYPAGGQLFTISVSNAISLGTYIIPMTGTSDSGLSKTVYYSLTVYGAFDFAFTWDTTSPCTGAASCSDTIYQGSSASGNSGVVAYNSPLARTVNFSNTVVNTSTGLAEPSITVSIPASCATTCILPVLISTGANTPATPSGTPYTVAITGDDGSGVAHSITYNLTVKLPPTNYNMMGWAWSDNIGWISFNAQNCDTDWDGFSDGGNAGCPVAGTLIPNYGINLNLSTYELSGEAWNNEIGWITFTRSFATNGQCAGGITTECPPAAPYNTTSDAYIAELKDGKVQGWARATSGIGENWGWLALTGASYGVTNLGASDFQGWAWGGDVMGWISFNSINCDADTDGLIDASCGANAGKTAYPYKVWVRGTLPCSPPTATSLSSNFLDRCGQPYNPTLSFTYKDSQLNPLLQYTIKIYDYACDTNKDAVIDGSAPGYCATNPFPTDTYVYAGSPIATNALGLANVDYQYNGASKLDYNKSYYFTVTVQSICNLD